MLVRHCLPSRFLQAFRLQRRWQSILRINPLGIQMLSTSLHEKLFGKDAEPTYSEADVKKSEKHLKEFGLGSSQSETLEDIDFQLPALEGENLTEHFKIIAQEQSQPYSNLMDQLMQATIPPQPKQWIYAKGWTKCVDRDP
jgi:DNA polymerase gamma 1